VAPAKCILLEECLNILSAAAQALSILRGQVPWRKRQRAEQLINPSTPPQPLRSTVSAPIGSIEAATAAHAAEEASDGEWSMQGPYNFDRWRDMIERQVFLLSLLASFTVQCMAGTAKAAVLRRCVRAASQFFFITHHHPLALSGCKQRMLTEYCSWLHSNNRLEKFMHLPRNCKFYSLIRPFDKDDLRMLAKVAGFFSNQAQQRLAPFELTQGQWQAFGNWFMSYLRLFRCHQQLWMMRGPTAICGFGVDRARAETLLAHQPSVSPLSSSSLALSHHIL
jgi:hypothetical protein